MQITVSRRGSRPEQIESSKFPETTLNHALKIGFQNLFRDSYAGAMKAAGEKATEEEINKIADEMFDAKSVALMAGVTESVGGARSNDPVATEVRRILIAAATDAIMKATPGLKRADVKPEDIQKRVDGVSDAVRARVTIQASIVVEARNAAKADIEI